VDPVTRTTTVSQQQLAARDPAAVS
jgi:glycosyltransferase involved in cell wall biosynthesis